LQFDEMVMENGYGEGGIVMLPNPDAGRVDLTGDLCLLASMAESRTTRKKRATKKLSPKGATPSSKTKTAARRKHIRGADTRKRPGDRSKADKDGRRPSSAQACWPGYEPTPGKAAGEKGSCQPKAKQTKAERRGDQKAFAASRLSGER
jgi:hypothetical protein